MPFDLEENADYKNWVNKFNGGKQDYCKYLRHQVYKEANSEPKHIKRSQYEKTENL